MPHDKEGPSWTGCRWQLVAGRMRGKLAFANAFDAKEEGIELQGDTVKG